MGATWTFRTVYVGYGLGEQEGVGTSWKGRKCRKACGTAGTSTGMGVGDGLGVQVWETGWDTVIRIGPTTGALPREAFPEAFPFPLSAMHSRQSSQAYGKGWSYDGGSLPCDGRSL